MNMESDAVRYIVDRIEGDLAHLEAADGPELIIPLEWLPAGTDEGHVINTSSEADGDTLTIMFTLDPAATEDRYERARELRAGLIRGPEGDIEL